MVAKYTTEVRTICEFFANESNQTLSTSLTVNQTISTALPKIFNFDFPIFDENYRIPLETKILKHFYTREIGLETFGLWQLKLDTKLNEIMPYYNQLYKSELLEFNPLYDVDVNTTTNKTLSEDTTNTGESETNSTNESATKDTQTITDSTTNVENRNEKNAFSDTPQTQLENVESLTYLTDYRNIQNENTTNANYTSSNERNGENNSSANIKNNSTDTKNLNSTEEYVQNVTGKHGSASYSEMLKEFRETFLNIDSMVINELDELFMQIW